MAGPMLVAQAHASWPGAQPTATGTVGWGGGAGRCRGPSRSWPGVTFARWRGWCRGWNWSWRGVTFARWLAWVPGWNWSCPGVTFAR